MDWKTGTVEGTELITIDYEGMYCDEALKAIAEKAGGKVEWWVDNLGRLFHPFRAISLPAVRSFYLDKPYTCGIPEHPLTDRLM